MEKEEDKGVTVIDKAKRKAPHLELTEAVTSDPREEAVTSDTSSEQCEHFCYDTEEMATLLAKIRSLKDNPLCEGCRSETARRIAAGGVNEDPLKEKLSAHIMMCSECSRCFCADVGTKEDEPGGHARWHADKADHQVALWIDQPDAAYCFECGHSLCLQVIIDAVDDEAGGYGSGSADGRGYVVRGMKNLGNTCYANALVQCLLVLDKPRMWMLGPDAPTGPIGTALTELFMETRAGSDAGAMMNLKVLLESVGALNSKYKGRDMEDSQEFLNYLRVGLNEEEMLKRPPNMPKDVPTVVESIFGGQLSTTYYCGHCPYISPSHARFYELQLPLPAKERPTRSVASPQRGRRSRRKRPPVKERFPALQDSEKAQTVVDGGGSHISGTDMESLAMEQALKPLEVDKSKVEDSNSIASIKDCVAFYFKEKFIDWRCEKCSNKVPEQPSTSRSEDGGQVVAATDKNTSVNRDQTEQSDRKACQNEQSSDMNMKKQTKLDNSAHKVGENQNEQRDTSGQGIVRTLISKLPPVLTVHLLRFEKEKIFVLKTSGHVSFEEILDVGSFLDPSSEDKDHSTYGLVGVIEHVGTLDCGHYVAYVRASRKSSHQQLSSGSSLWFRASDSNIKEVSLEEVLKCEVFLLFYERMEG